MEYRSGRIGENIVESVVEQALPLPTAVRLARAPCSSRHHGGLNELGHLAASGLKRQRGKAARTRSAAAADGVGRTLNERSIGCPSVSTTNWTTSA